jgi:iron complex transport system substrate-binding protein
MNRLLVRLMALLLLLAPVLASAEEFTLNIFGNANMDEIIDQQDIAYINGIIAGAKESTNLSDADGDGDVDSSDAYTVGQIINGTEDHLRYINMKGEASQVKHPLKKIVIVYDATAEVVRKSIRV